MKRCAADFERDDGLLRHCRRRSGLCWFNRRHFSDVLARLPLGNLIAVDDDGDGAGDEKEDVVLGTVLRGEPLAFLEFK